MVYRDWVSSACSGENDNLCHTVMHSRVQAFMFGDTGVRNWERRD